MTNRMILTAVLLTAAAAAFAQGIKVQGIIIDDKEKTPQIGVTVLLTRSTDSLVLGAATDVDGRFLLANVNPGTYKLTTSYLGYLPVEKTVTVETTDLDLGRLAISQNDNLLKEVVVAEKQIRVEQKGDTTQFNADAYKTNQNATVEDLVKKMPGITVEDGVVKVQGEELKKLTIDGEEFFGDDATVALKNLPAEIVNKIQVFDQLSDQSQFTGFDDGNAQKTLNIVTKTGKANGQFGKVYAGYGTDDRYIGGANLNYFKGKRRISLIGLSNNINQQNFSSQDLLGVTGASGGGGGGRRGGGGRGQGGPGGGGNSAGNFLVGQQAGISTVNSVGLNYIDRWGSKIRVNGSYFFNNNNNEKTSELTRQYFLNGESSQLYDETSNAESDNFNHRFNARLEYNIDSSNSLSLRPSLSFQDNSQLSNFLGQNYFSIDNPLNITQNRSTSNSNGYTFSNDLLYRHKFSKPGRTVSVNLGTRMNTNNGERYLYSQNRYFEVIDTTELLDQRTISASDGLTVSSSVSYTEPVGKKGQIQINYSPSYNINNSDKQANSIDSTGNYAIPETLLSSRFNNEVTTQRSGLSYNLRQEKTSFSAGLNFQLVQLNSEQTFPTAFNLDKTFRNLLPDARFNFRPSKNKNLRLQYRTSTNVPGISQLQNVLDNTNPLLLSIGNPDLRQPYTHTISARFNTSNAQKATNFVAFGYVGLTDNYIGNSTLIATGDTTVLGNITLLSGAQLTRPVNLDGYRNARTFLSYGFYLSKLKSNLNLNTGFTYLHSPSQVNNVSNFVNTYATNAGLVLSSNISQRIDFTVSYSANYSVVDNSLQPQLNNNYFFHNAGVKLNWEIIKRFTVSNDLTQTTYSGLGSGFNQQYWLWNVTMGYRMLKNEALELKLGVFDLLDQNNSIARTINETYVEDSVTNVLRRYFMVTAVYSLRNFGG